MANAPPGAAALVDYEKHPTAKKLVDRCFEFLAEIQDLTPGWRLEERLNREYSPGTAYYDDFAKYIEQGLEEGWVAETELEGRKYRRGKLALPSPESRYFSITVVYMDSEQAFSGQYHAHPYGEINCIIPITPMAQGRGMRGWQGAGWTSPGPGTHHYPQGRGGASVQLFFLPAGRIAYDKEPGSEQPESL